MTTLVLGATGYAGRVLLRILLTHPKVDRVIAASSSQVGEGVETNEFNRRTMEKLSPATYVDANTLPTGGGHDDSVDVVFAALPHLASSAACRRFYPHALIVDLSADLRLRDFDRFEAAYGSPVPDPELARMAVYGLSEVYTQEVGGSKVIANPGCYPTATLLPLIPLVRAGVVAGPIVVNAISGISGAGRKPKPNLTFVARTETVAAYAPGASHRHHAEIAEQLSLSGYDGPLTFTPHLAPVKQGMLATTFVATSGTVSRSDALAILHEAYEDRPWVRILSDQLPETHLVRNTNRCDIAVHAERGSLVLVSAIDNLVKGAAGQAVQNMNIRLGFDEEAGLPAIGDLS